MVRIRVQIADSGWGLGIRLGIRLRIRAGV